MLSDGVSGAGIRRLLGFLLLYLFDVADATMLEGGGNWNALNCALACVIVLLL